MARKYSDYIRVDEDFIPVFSIHKDKEYPNKWKSFFPHDSFKTIVSQMIDTLEMNSAEKEKPLWVSGAYGTGKTFASFVIKHLLEDDIESIKPYFESNNMMPSYARLNGIRSKGNILVVHRSSSASITGENRLLNSIRESIKVALKDKGYDYLGQKSQYDTILSTLKDPQSAFNFTNAFNKYKSKFTDYASPESVIRDLEELDLDEGIELLETIVEVAEKENYVWSTSVDEVINWIDDVVKGNSLQAIVFVWDEFTEFFKANNVGGIQEIAHAASAIKFYFFLITHSTSSQLIKDPNARKVIEARFKLPIIEMADTTAFKLLGQAIVPNPDLSDEWKKEIAGLWQRVEKITKNTLLKHSTDITESELQHLLPFHPYAAHLLKIISKDISSNQRTMFQFLSGDYLDGDNVKNNFRWFIENNSNEMNGWNYLTANYIWDYFFTDDNVDFDETFKSVISHYNNYKSFCGGDEDKENVLKVSLLLTAMQQKSGADRNQGISGLLRPTLYNISACFTGTPIESSISNIMAEFVQKGVFGKIEEANDTLYVSPLGNIDEDRFKQMKEEMRKQIPFEKILTDSTYNVYERFMPDSMYLQQRFIIGVITPTEFRTTVDRVIGECKKSNIPMFYLFAKNETEQAKINGVIKRIFEDYGRELVIVDFSNHIFTDALYDKFINSKTEERYYNNNPNQQGQSKLAKKNAESAVNEWKNKLDMTSLDVYTSVSEVSKCQGGANLRKKMKEINASIFVYGLEQISIHDSLFKPQGFKETVGQMGMSKAIIPSNHSYLNGISTKLRNENIWENPSYYIDNPTHTVSQMKLAVEKTIKVGFQNNNMVCIADIWDTLESKPFGLQSCSGALFMIGFLLKEYADSKYHKYDGANTVTLNYTDLSDIIFGTMRDNAKAKEQYIVEQKPEHIEFCHITGTIFKIATNKQNSIEDIAKYMKMFLADNEYPLWPLCSYIKERLSDNDLQEPCLTAINLFCEFISSGNIAGRDKTKVAEELYRLYKINAGLAEELAKIIIVDNMKSGMQFYIGHYKPELINLTTKLGITAEEYIISLNKKLSSDSTYLWEIGDTDRQIDNLFDDYRLIDAVNSILPEKKKSYDKITEGLKDKLNLIKLPYTLITDKSSLSAMLNVLVLIKDKSHFDKCDAIKLIQDNCDEFNTFFNSQFTLFADVAKQQLNQTFEPDEIDAMFSSVSTGAFFEQADIYLQNISIALDKHRKNKKSNRLNELWVTATNSNNPIEWSNTHTLPILCLYQGSDEILFAQKVFDIINKTRIPQGEKEIDEAISFVQGGNLERLNDITKCDDIFKHYFSGVYHLLFESADELKKVIKKAVSGNVYDWISKKQTIDGIIKVKAEEKYATTYKAKAKEKIKKLSPEKAYALLEELIEDKPLVGINLLQD